MGSDRKTEYRSEDLKNLSGNTRLGSVRLDICTKLLSFM